MADEALDLQRARLASGDLEAFAAFYDQHAPGMWIAARTLLGNQPDAEDAVQQTFLNLFQSRRGFARAKSTRAYAFAALRHAATRIRERRREVSLPEEIGEAREEAHAEAADQLGALGRALLTLPAEQRDVLALKFDGGLSFGEIGVAMAISPNTAASRYRYALERLAQVLGKQS